MVFNSIVKEREVIFINPNISEAGKMTRFNSDTARIAGRKGGKAKAEKEKRLADFGETMNAILTSGDLTLDDGTKCDPVTAICLRMIEKVLDDGDVPAFKAIIELMEKHNDKTASNDDDNVLLFIESMRRNEEKQK